ncbi:MAG: tyrosine--tRNA ligase [Ruminococcus sp.]|jgi:tyrosyl-tRNA synthetase|nr:tyrosine--tRNA ligase [Ruminococcus sp.]
MKLSQELKRRNLIAQMTHEKEIFDILDNQKVSFYIGFDATADSLHVGHFLQLVVMKRMAMAGHKPIALLGTATTMIGDPTGKTDMRPMLTEDDINHNAENFKKQMTAILGENNFEIVKNGDWLLDMNYIDFLRNVGRHFSVNQMLTAECFKTRLEKGLSFLEFNYMLMQSYDFLYLYQSKGVKLELGGNDQWSNILGGVDLIRRVEQGNAYGLTFTLLTTKEGKKMGKTEKGALWLDKEKCPVYDFYQYWRNIDDADVFNCLRLLTFIDIDEIDELEKSDININDVKSRLAFELTKMVHGEEEAVIAQDTAKKLFSGGISDDMPTTTVSSSKINILDLLIECKLIPSKGEGKRLIQQGGISVDDKKITDFNSVVEISDFVIIKKGKKIYHKAILQK